uniref:Uncharacterized protein n=1 Tax=Solanum lycopersicum TaxID=4081 RepID=A0A494GA85_SOLLC
MQVYVNHNIVTDLKGKLTATQFNHFKDTCFGAYTKMHVCGAQPQMFRCFMVWGGNDDDAVKFAILYFICTFIYSGEKKSSSIPRIHFDLVESGRYHEYP